MNQLFYHIFHTFSLFFFSQSPQNPDDFNQQGFDFVLQKQLKTISKLFNHRPSYFFSSVDEKAIAVYDLEEKFNSLSQVFLSLIPKDPIIQDTTNEQYSSRIREDMKANLKSEDFIDSSFCEISNIICSLICQSQENSKEAFSQAEKQIMKSLKEIQKIIQRANLIVQYHSFIYENSKELLSKIEK